MNAQIGAIHTKVISYPVPSVQKYVAIRMGIPIKKRRYFGFEIRGVENASRYMFFFNTLKGAIEDKTPIVLTAYKHTVEGYHKLSILHERGFVAPDIFEIGYDIEAKCFISNGVAGVRKRNPQKLAKSFVKQVVERDFGA